MRVFVFSENTMHVLFSSEIMVIVRRVTLHSSFIVDIGALVVMSTSLLFQAVLDVPSMTHMDM